MSTFVLFHGGAGAHSMSGLADALKAYGQVIAPTLPGFDGSERPASIASVADLAQHYLQMLARDNLRDVVLVGNSLGGWVAVEMALRDPSRIARIVLIDAVGIEGTIIDPMELAPPERLTHSFHNVRLALRLARPDSSPSAMLANAATLKVYAGEHFMFDPTLPERMTQLRLPATVIWGESDRIVDVAYGKRYAAAIPNARFVLIERAGHFPQVEQPEATIAAITSL